MSWLLLIVPVLVIVSFALWMRAQECPGCGESLFNTHGCYVTAYEYLDDAWPRQRSELEQDCPWCACPPGTLHHVDCENEPCPRCGDLPVDCRCLRTFIPVEAAVSG